MKKNELGKIIREQRKARGMTQTDLANYLGVATSTVGMWETGKRVPEFETAEKMADLFHHRLSNLIPDTAEENDVTPSTSSGSSSYSVGPDSSGTSSDSYISSGSARNTDSWSPNRSEDFSMTLGFAHRPSLEDLELRQNDAQADFDSLISNLDRLKGALVAVSNEEKRLLKMYRMMDSSAKTAILRFASSFVPESKLR